MKAKNTNTPITTNPQVEDSSAEHIETVHSDLDQIQRRKKKRVSLESNLPNGSLSKNALGNCKILANKS